MKAGGCNTISVSGTYYMSCLLFARSGKSGVHDGRPGWGWEGSRMRERQQACWMQGTLGEARGGSRDARGTYRQAGRKREYDGIRDEGRARWSEVERGRRQHLAVWACQH